MHCGLRLLHRDLWPPLPPSPEQTHYLLPLALLPAVAQTRTHVFPPPQPHHPLCSTSACTCSRGVECAYSASIKMWSFGSECTRQNCTLCCVIECDLSFRKHCHCLLLVEQLSRWSVGGCSWFVSLHGAPPLSGCENFVVWPMLEAMDTTCQRSLLTKLIKNDLMHIYKSIIVYLWFFFPHSWYCKHALFLLVMLIKKMFLSVNILFIKHSAKA